MTTHIIESIPLWGILLLTLVLSTVSFEIGFAFGGLRQRKVRVQETIATSIVVAAILGLLVLVLAFTFSMATTLFEDRQTIILDEANAISTTFLRSELLPEPYKTEIQNSMRKYVSLMVEGLKRGNYEQLIKKFENYHDQLWNQVERLMENDHQSMTVSLFIQSLNDVINIHFKKVMKGGKTSIPETIWFVIFIVAFIAFLALGYFIGMLGHGSVLLSTLLILTFSAVVFLTADLDRPHEGLFRIGQEVLVASYEEMNAPAYITD